MMQSEEILRLKSTKHEPVEAIQNLGQVTPSTPSECSCDPCKHINTVKGASGMPDCLDCGGKEIDYQPCDWCLDRNPFKADVPFPLDPSDFTDEIVSAADALLEFTPIGEEINFEDAIKGMEFEK